MTTFLKKDGGLVSYNGKLLKKTDVTVPTDHMPHVKEIVTDSAGMPLMDTTGNLFHKWRPYVYNDATVQSMLTPAAYSAGTYPYGWCVTDSGNTYQVNNYSGTSEAVEHADWDNLGAGAYFVPVATHQDLNDVRAAITKTWGAGTPFEASYVGQGLAGNYIQVSDIDLYDECRTGGAYDNSGEGWNPIVNFIGRYIGGGRFIQNLYINSNTQSRALFFGDITAGTNPGGVYIGINIVNCYIWGGFNSAPLVATAYGTVVRNCMASGYVRYISTLTARWVGGLVGRMFPNTKIYDSISMCVVDGRGIAGMGGITGRSQDGTNIIENCYSVGYVFNTSGLEGGIIGFNDGTVTASYYNTETSGQSDTGKGVPKTTAELLSGVPSAGIYTDWDTRIWRFVNSRYLIHKFFGELPVNIPAPTNLQTAISGSDIVLTWDDYTGAPKPLGYFVYYSQDNGAWTKLNETALTDKTYTVTSPAAGSYNFFVTAQYKRRYTGETGNSVTTLQTIT